MDIDRQEKGKILLEHLEKRADGHPHRKEILEGTLAFLVNKGLLYESREFVKLLKRGLVKNELVTICDKCFEENREDEIRDTLEMLILLEAKEREGLFVVE